VGKVEEIEAEVTEDEYQEILDDMFPEVVIGGLSWTAGYVIREMDPTAFRCGKVDYEDTLDRKWKCLECGEEHDTEEEAQDCCPVVSPEEDE